MKVYDITLTAYKDNKPVKTLDIVHESEFSSVSDYQNLFDEVLTSNDGIFDRLEQDIDYDEVYAQIKIANPVDLPYEKALDNIYTLLELFSDSPSEWCKKCIDLLERNPEPIIAEYAGTN